MKTKPLFVVGDAVDVLLGSAWLPATVCWIGAWSEIGGNENPVYQAEFVDGGGKMMFGQNSIRVRGIERGCDL